MQNNRCDGSGPCHPGRVRVLPTSRDPWGSNAILCGECFKREIAWRKERNRKLGKAEQFDLPAWGDLKPYREDAEEKEVA